jgi:SAM-dependent methyltransferase
MTAGTFRTRPRPLSPATAISMLAAHASRLYRPAGRFAWLFARAKLRFDPVYSTVLAAGLIPDGARILDLGCGQGLLGAWLMAAQLCRGAGWPRHWPAPPHPLLLHGIERSAAEVARARLALAQPNAWPMQIELGDIRQKMPCGADAYDVAVLFDVLHYLDLDAQEAVLRRVHAILAPGGKMVLRVGDASAGRRARYSRTVDRIVQLMRMHCATPLNCRSFDAWLTLLSRLGFIVREVPLPADAHGANRLLVAWRAEPV